MASRVKDTFAAVDRALALLIGLPFYDYGQLLDVKVFAFGEPRTIVGRRWAVRGRRYPAHEYQLHLGTRWRLWLGNVMVVEAGASMLVGEGNATRPSNQSSDAIAAALISPPYMVTTVSTDGSGGASINMTEGVSLSIDRPTVPGESWHLFGEATGRPHLSVALPEDTRIVAVDFDE
jgi:hypothetical protein